MKETFNRMLDRNTYEIFAGELCVTIERDMVLTTLLGSCVSVCLSDRTNRVYGINHFMLPGRAENLKGSREPRYGICSLPLLLDGMYYLGAKRQNLEAKVFGGGKVVESMFSNVAKANVEFAFSYLEAAGIPVAAFDVGQDYGRKIFFFPVTNEVFMKKIKNYNSIQVAVEKDKSFVNWIKQNIENK